MAETILKKPAAFQDEFVRRPGSDKYNTHYCAGCGHGVVHKLIAEALSDMGLQDRAIFIAPVGCSVFLYYYFNCCALSVPHGRAPAALTGISRAHPDAICISYQGDGDLAAIGTAEIIHAANRGERMAVFFVNNAIYGMTGGQMAPTTLVNMRTSTSPSGRSLENDGAPIHVCEMLATLDAPVYIERVAVDSPKATMRARAAIRKSLQIQADRKGFALVEILSPCPTNWRMSPTKASEWLREKMYPVFPPGVFKDRVAEAPSLPREHQEISRDELFELLDVKNAPPRTHPENPLKPLLRYKLAGYGGQGVLLLGTIIAQAGMSQGYHVTWLPSYGPEMRGGTANSSVILSSDKIGSPVVNHIDVLLSLNALSLERFLPDIQPGGLAIYNTSVVENPPAAPGNIRLVGVPALQLAEETGDERAANVVMLGAYNAITGVFDQANLEKALDETFTRPALNTLNRKAVRAGADFIRSLELPGN